MRGRTSTTSRGHRSLEHSTATPELTLPPTRGVVSHHAESENSTQHPDPPTGAVVTTLTDALARLRPLVADCYPTPGDARRVAHDADLPRARVLFEQAPDKAWHELLTLTRLRRLLPALLAQIEDEYGKTNPELSVALAAVRVALDADDGTVDVLHPGTAPRPRDLAPSQFLDARYEIVPWYDGARDGTLAALDAWGGEGARALVRLLHAEGGVGKTRLAIEWSRRLRERGWCAGFLAKDAPTDWYDDLCAWGVPTLVVVDYAESRPELLDGLRALRTVQAKGGAPTLRVLLLARNDGDWWTQLTQDRELGPWLKERDPERITAVAAEVPGRAAVFREAVAAYAKVRGKTVPEPKGLCFDDASFGRVLYLHMAALAVVEGLSVTAGTLMDTILDHEERFWERRGREGGDALNVAIHLTEARQFVAAGTLRGGFASQDEARGVFKRMVDRSLDRDDTRLLMLLHRVYERRGEPVWQPPLEPDLLGEAMVVRVAQPARVEEVAPTDWIDRVFPAESARETVRVGFTVLGRASAWAPEATRAWIEGMLCRSLDVRAVLALDAAKVVGWHTAFSLLGEALADALESRGEVPVAEALERAGVPTFSVSLRRVAEWKSRMLLSATSESEEGPIERAIHLNNHSIELGELRRHEESLATAREAIAIGRRAAESNSGACLDILGGMLNNLGARLCMMERYEEAREVLVESVQVRRQIMAQHPEMTTPGLAGSLDNLGSALEGLGRYEESLAATQEAMELYCQLVREDEAFLPSFAMSIDNLGIRLSKLGRHDEGLEASQKALGIYRVLSAQLPDAFLPTLAGVLNNASVRLSEVGRYEEALNAVQEAVQIRRFLAQRDPEAFLSELAVSLANQADRMRLLNRHAEALPVAEEAFDILWPFFECVPQTFARIIARMVRQLTKLYDSLNFAPSSLFNERSRRLQQITQPQQLFPGSTAARGQPSSREHKRQ